MDSPTRPAWGYGSGGRGFESLRVRNSSLPLWAAAPLHIGRSAHQRSTATTPALRGSARVSVRDVARERRSSRQLRGVRDEEVAGSNPVTPTTEGLVSVHL